MTDKNTTGYHVLLHEQAYLNLLDYLQALQSGDLLPGGYLEEQLKSRDMARLSGESLLDCLLRTKRPQIFAESAVFGDGRDWNNKELKLLGDIGIAVAVTVYDDGRHHNPMVYKEPFTAHLLFIPGALLRNGTRQTPADWDVVSDDGDIDSERFYRLYRCRLLSLLFYANSLAIASGKEAFITVPGLGCGQFAGRFRGQLGEMIKRVLLRLLRECHDRLSGIRALYFDPYDECDNRRYEIGHLSFLVRPLARGNWNKPQLCKPSVYQEAGDDFGRCQLFSIVAWDHVSWPGNDFYLGARVTDDGVKAAATSAIAAMTGVEGRYNKARHGYEPPPPYRNWEAVVMEKGLHIDVAERLRIISTVAGHV